VELHHRGQTQTASAITNYDQVILSRPLSFQDGTFNVNVGGVGAIDKGPYIGYAAHPACRRSATSYGGGGGLGVGVTFMHGLTDEQGGPGDNETDVFIGGGWQVGGMHTVASWHP
jgi:hypothetical protein